MACYGQGLGIIIRRDTGLVYAAARDFHLVGWSLVTTIGASWSPGPGPLVALKED